MTGPQRHRAAWGPATAALAALALAACATAPAAPSEGHGPIPDSQISVQMFTFFYDIGFGETDAEQQRQEEVLATLSDAGYTHIEAVDYTGFQGLSTSDYRALLDAYGLEVSSLHTTVTATTSDAQWADALDKAETLGTSYVGGGVNPSDFTTAEEWIAYAELIDHLGAMARERGLTYLLHPHDWEFTSVYDGVSAFEILLEHTSPANVVVELDLYWAVAAGEDPVALIETYGDRIALLHVKDMAEDGTITTVGEGTLDFPAIFAAAGDRIAYYVIERDPPQGDDAFDPLGPSVAGLRYLQTVDF